jgi:hypothetical protein
MRVICFLFLMILIGGCSSPYRIYVRNNAQVSKNVTILLYPGDYQKEFRFVFGNNIEKIEYRLKDTFSHELSVLPEKGQLKISVAPGVTYFITEGINSNQVFKGLVIEDRIDTIYFNQREKFNITKQGLNYYAGYIDL